MATYLAGIESVVTGIAGRLSTNVGDQFALGKKPLSNVSSNNKTGILAAWEIHPVSAITADGSVFPQEVL